MTGGGPGEPAGPAPAAARRTFRIVISYRRVDTGGDARSLAEALERRFGRENVFLDIETIEPGEPFDEAIDRAVASSDVLLVLIGQHWLTLADDDGRRRIDDPRDVVRLEVGSALARELRVIPVLLEGAKMPSEEELPPELAALSKRNAVDLRATSWHPDVQRFVEELAELRREKLRRLGPQRGWRRWLVPVAEAAGGLGRALARRPRAGLAGGLAVAVLVAAFVLVLVVRGGNGEDDALHAPLAADETLAFVSGGRILLLDGDAPRPVPLAGAGFRTAPDWTVDGRRIAFAQGGNIRVADRDGANARALTTDGARDRAPAWSEDGALVAFDRPESDDERRRGIWVVPGDGTGEPIDLQAGAGEVGAAPDWSPNGRSLVYQRGFRIWIMAADGSDQRPLVDGFDRRSLFPAWAPNGTRIAFVLVDARPCEIGLARPDGGDVQILRPGRPETCGELAWAPDARHLAFGSREGGLWAVSRDGGEVTRLLDRDQASSPSWARAPG